MSHLRPPAGPLGQGARAGVCSKQSPVSERGLCQSPRVSLAGTPGLTLLMCSGQIEGRGQWGSSDTGRCPKMREEDEKYFYSVSIVNIRQVHQYKTRTEFLVAAMDYF